MGTLRNVLAAVDFSPMTQPVLDAAAELAVAFGAKVWVVHVAPPEPKFVGFDVGPDSVRQQLAEELRDEHRQVQALAAGLRERGLDATGLLIEGPTLETLADEARRLEAGRIVVGSHGHGAVYRTLVGSFSEEILRRAPCPVLVLPDPRRLDSDA